MKKKLVLFCWAARSISIAIAQNSTGTPDTFNPKYPPVHDPVMA